MMIVQLFPAFKVLGQNSAPMNPVESSPEIAPTLKLLKVTIDEPVLVTVSNANEVEPGYVVPKFSVLGENFSVEPVEFTVCVVPLAVLLPV
jgi:hypothetical protein